MSVDILEKIRQGAQSQIDKLRSDKDYGGSSDYEAINTRIFEDLKDHFGYDWEEDEEAATQPEINEYILATIIPEIILKERKDSTFKGKGLLPQINKSGLNLYEITCKNKIDENLVFFVEDTTEHGALLKMLQNTRDKVSYFVTIDINLRTAVKDIIK